VGVVVRRLSSRKSSVSDMFFVATVRQGLLTVQKSTIIIHYHEMKKNNLFIFHNQLHSSDVCLIHQWLLSIVGDHMQQCDNLNTGPVALDGCHTSDGHITSQSSLHCCLLSVGWKKIIGTSKNKKPDKSHWWIKQKSELCKFKITVQCTYPKLHHPIFNHSENSGLSNIHTNKHIDK